MTRPLDPTTPLEESSPRASSRPARYAGGWPAVVSTLRYTTAQTGVVRGLRVLARVNQKAGFDCPGCAWPEPAERALAEFCENGARAVADEATKRRVNPEFFGRHSVRGLQARSDQWLNAQGRLTHPMLLEQGASHYRPITWDQAFSLVGQQLRSLSDPNQAIFYTSGRASNEAAFLYQLFARHFGTNNLPDCSNMCHESSGRGLGETLGTGKGTVRLEDFEHADAIFVIGQNPGTNHPRMLSALREAKQRGATIVAINPLKEPGLLRFQHPQKPTDLFGGVPLSDLYLQVRGGGDIALFKAMMKLMVEADALDHDFIAQHTVSVEALLADLRRQDMSELVRESGVQERDIRRAADVAIRSRATICCWAMGLTQHAHAVGNIHEVVNFLLLRGMLGKPGAGACPVRGHSNVQGDRTMGICERPPPWTQALAERFGFEAPLQHGYDTVGALQAMFAGDARVFFALGGNFLSATPDTERTAQALRRCELTVQVSTKLNRSHLVTGKRALILPCLGRTEVDGAGFVTVEDSMSAVHASRGRLTPASPELLAEVAIICGVALATLGSVTRVDWAELADDYSKIRDLIAATIPDFHDFNERASDPTGFFLRNPARELDFEAVGGKARFTVVERPCIELEPGQLLLNTLRAHDQFNTTIYDSNDRYRGVYGQRRVILIHPDDLAEQDIEAGDRVDITSHFRNERRTARRFTAVAYDVPRGCAAAYFPEANALVPTDHYAEGSRTPASKSVVVSLRKSPEVSVSAERPS